jgi:hypothetical protein
MSSNSNKNNLNIKAYYLGAWSFIFGLLVFIYTVWEDLTAPISMPSGIAILLLLSTIAIFILISFKKTLQLKEKFDKAIFEKHLNGAKKICILNTFAPNFNDELKEILIEALINEISVEVLLWNPYCEEVQYREETLPEWNIAETIKQNINFLQEIFNETKNKNRLELRLYDSWAPFSLYSSDQGASIGFYMNGTLAVEGPQLVITTKAPSFDKFMDQFTKIWATGKSFDFSKNDCQRVLDRDFR